MVQAQHLPVNADTVIPSGPPVRSYVQETATAGISNHFKSSLKRYSSAAQVFPPCVSLYDVRMREDWHAVSNARPNRAVFIVDTPSGVDEPSLPNLPSISMEPGQ